MSGGSTGRRMGQPLEAAGGESSAERGSGTEGGVPALWPAAESQLTLLTR